MVEKIAWHLTQWMVNQNIIEHEDEEVYAYGWAITISAFGSFAVILLIGACLGQLAGTALFLSFHTLLRIFAGGYHADSYRRCFCLTMSLYAIAPVLHFYLPSGYIELVIAALLLSAIVITWRWAPVDHPNKPMSKEVAQKHKTISRRLVMGQAGIIMLVWLWQPWLKQYLLWAVAGMAVTSFTLLYVIYYPYKERGEEK
ncbi:MAG: accessory gene regulator ArgB-like protein [Sporomusa sp.]